MRDLAPAGELTSPQTYPFEFDNVEMQYDSYRGLQVRLRCAPCNRTCLYSACCPACLLFGAYVAWYRLTRLSVGLA